MTTSVPRRFIVLQVALAVVLAAELACRADRPVAPSVGDPSFAKGGPTANPTVTSTTPSSAKRDTTLNVTVTGSGFDQGSRAVWALSGDTTFAKTKVKTNSTSYVSARQLVASITIAADAPVDLYDVVVVTQSGRKGIGIELFAISVVADLGVLNDSLKSIAYGANDGGTIVGVADVRSGVNSVSHAVKWIPAGTSWTISDFGPVLSTGWSSADNINVNGDIVGTRETGTGEWRAYVMMANGTVTDLGVPSGMSYSEGYDINAKDEVIGVTGPRGSTSQPFYWSAATGMVVLPGLPGATAPAGVAASINDNSVIVGYTTDGSANFAVRWERVAGVWTPTKLPSGQGINAWAISPNGNIVGTGCAPNVSPCVNRAYFWPAGGARVDLGTLGGDRSEANGVNDAGRVVGLSTTKTGVTRGFSWTASGGMKELPALGGGKTVSWAQAISNAGIIVGASSIGFGPWHGIVWIVP
jgi:probable HAF family extracellular repeat protein